MPKARKKKAPITATSTAAVISSKPQSSRTVIRRFHVLLKEKAKLTNFGGHGTGNTETLAHIEEELAGLGGLESYQQMSVIGQGNDRGGGSEKVLIQWLKELGMAEKRDSGRHLLKLLEVGALKPDNYSSCSSWIEATPIDLHSRHPAIAEQDFLLMDETEHHHRWEIISMSLVLNFAPEPKDRGRMLRLAHHMLVPGGLFFLALPLPCVLNSRYLDMETLKALMTAVGFVEVKSRWKKGGKMAYWLYRKHPETPDTKTNIFQKKTVLRTGNRNNFSILL